ncbi:MAG: ABC transporter permease [Pseudomonadota bacterium]
MSFRHAYRGRRRYRGVVAALSMGLFGFVTILAVGEHVENDLCNNLEMLADARILRAYWDFSGPNRHHLGQYGEKDVDDIRGLPGVASASPAVSTRLTTVMRKHRGIHGVRVMGVDDSFFRTMRIPASPGRLIGPDDVESQRLVCLMGPKLVPKLFSAGTSPIDRTIAVNAYNFTLIGILGGIEYDWLAEIIFIPLPVARSRFRMMQETRDIFVRAVNWEMVPIIRNNMYTVLTRNHPLHSEQIRVNYERERIEKINTTVWLLKSLIYTSFVVVTLLGALGVTNVMSAAVRERTVEIGLRKALGASDSDIMSQFLMEAVVVCVMGVFGGVLVGVIAVETLRSAFHIMPSYTVLRAGLLGSAVSGFVLGLVAGWSPARKASLLDPVEAMRFE